MQDDTNWSVADCSFEEQNQQIQSDKAEEVAI